MLILINEIFVFHYLVRLRTGIMKELKEKKNEKKNMQKLKASDMSILQDYRYYVIMQLFLSTSLHNPYFVKLRFPEQ